MSGRTGSWATRCARLAEHDSKPMQGRRDDNVGAGAAGIVDAVVLAFLCHSCL